MKFTMTLEWAFGFTARITLVRKPSEIVSYAHAYALDYISWDDTSTCSHLGQVTDIAGGLDDIVAR